MAVDWGVPWYQRQACTENPLCVLEDQATHGSDAFPRGLSYHFSKPIRMVDRHAVIYQGNNLPVCSMNPFIDKSRQSRRMG